MTVHFCRVPQENSISAGKNIMLNMSWKRIISNGTYCRTLWNRSKSRSSAAKGAGHKKPHHSVNQKQTGFKRWFCRNEWKTNICLFFPNTGNAADLGLTGLLLLWWLAALWCRQVLCLWLWLRLWLWMCTRMRTLAFGPGHQAEPRGWAGTGRLQYFTQRGTEFCFLFLL